MTPIFMIRLLQYYYKNRSSAETLALLDAIKAVILDTNNGEKWGASK